MRTLYDITDEYKELLDLLQTTDADEEVIQTTIESTGLKDDFRGKIDSYLYVIDDLEASSERIRNEEKRLADRRRMQERNAKKMKDALTDTMKLLNIQKEKTDKYTVWVQNNPSKLSVQDDQFIPQDFYEEQQPKLNRKKLTDYIKEGKEIKGVELTQSRGIRKR
ncbi:MAG: siphovirus Gp157 family protein [Staphylococcus equorum]|nr:siphovirus Gp157 family protein [Staphylococcus equorum]